MATVQLPRLFPDDRPVLGTTRIVSLVVAVRDLARARDFYANALGLPLLVDDGRCARFDAGGVVLELHPDGEAEEGRVTPVFCVDDLGDTVWQLARRGIHTARTVAYDRRGGTARLEGPGGTGLRLWEPSDEARDGPGGRKLEELVGAPA
ncbi:MAG TPA: VOC family protein [Longimicrobium sp.]|nr:VOC family protein [Longimicrobium sp.]